MRSTAMPTGCASCARGCCWPSSAARPAPWPRSAMARRGLETRAELARELGLGDPPITWHVVRDGIAETVQVLALLGGSLGKIAFDVMLMSATEFGEAAEPFVAGPRVELDDAAKAQPDLVRADPRRRQGAAPASGAGARRGRHRFRAGDRALACRMGGGAGSLRLRRRRAPSGAVHARRADRRSRPHGEEPGDDARADRRRGGDDGPGAAHRPQRGARPRLRRLPGCDRDRPAAARRAAGDPRRRRSARPGEAARVDRSRQLSRRRPGNGRPHARSAGRVEWTRVVTDPALGGSQPGQR